MTADELVERSGRIPFFTEQITQAITMILSGGIDQSVQQAQSSAQAAQLAAAAAELASSNPPEPRNGTWWVYDKETGQYVDTGEAARGPQGEAATGWGDFTASVDDTTGTPWVDVTSSGPANARNVHLALHNLKGEKGADGAGGGVGQNLSGRTVEYDGQQYTAAQGAERFNDYTYCAAVGQCAHAEGYNTFAASSCCHAEGASTKATGGFAHSEGSNTTASGFHSHSEGSQTTASGYGGHAEGSMTEASGYCAHSGGGFSIASGSYSFSHGYNNVASVEHSLAVGLGTLSENYAANAMGRYNRPTQKSSSAITVNDGDVVSIGNGQDINNRSNCFRVTYAGAVYGLAAFNSSGADYAEYFEWLDGNPEGEDRVGYFVTTRGKHIQLAGPGDYVLGVVSGNPCIIGNADEDWLGRWLHDDFGRFVRLEYEEELTTLEPVEVPILDAHGQDTGETRTELQQVPTGETATAKWYVQNPDYDSSQQYVERKDRPEWAPVGMLGVLAVRDDGTCQADGYARVAAGGIATAAESELSIVGGGIVKAYRVTERVSPSVVKIVFR